MSATAWMGVGIYLGLCLFLGKVIKRGMANERVQPTVKEDDKVFYRVRITPLIPSNHRWKSYETEVGTFEQIRTDLTKLGQSKYFDESGMQSLVIAHEIATSIRNFLRSKSPDCNWSNAWKVRSYWVNVEDCGCSRAIAERRRVRV